MTVRGGVTHCFYVAAAFATVAQLAPDPVALAFPASRLVLKLLMTAPPGLPPATRFALISETQSIWDEHVRLRWVDQKVEADNAAFLHVFIMPRAESMEDEDSPWMVGELVRRDGESATAIASLAGARRIVDDTGFQRFDLPAMYDRRLGIVLGRAVAHEIGHYLLQTNTHAGGGLMRARIQTGEFVDLRRTTFRFDKAAAAHLAAIASSGRFPPAERSAFSYEPR